MTVTGETQMKKKGRGKIRKQFSNEKGSAVNFELEGVLYVPDVKANFVSMSQTNEPLLSTASNKNLPERGSNLLTGGYHKILISVIYIHLFIIMFIQSSFLLII